MKPFEYETRHRNVILLDRKSANGSNPAPYKEEYIDNNSINLSLDDTIYRIFSVDKFKRTLADKKLCLVRPSKWEDPFENLLLNSVGQLADGTEVGFESIRDSYYGQCWTLRKECDGLWRNYKGREPAAIKVKTTVGKLMNQFYDLTNKFHELSYFIGKVEYATDEEIVDFFRDEIDLLSFQSNVEIVQSLLIKRLSFSYEEEVRLIFSRPSTNEIDLGSVRNPWDDSDRFFVNIDPDTLFDEIEIDPWITQAQYRSLESDIRALGFSGQVTRSSLYDKPFFITKIKSN